MLEKGKDHYPNEPKTPKNIGGRRTRTNLTKSQNKRAKLQQYEEVSTDTLGCEKFLGHSISLRGMRKHNQNMANELINISYSNTCHN